MDDKLKEHAYKEALKKIVDDSPYCPEQIKTDVKSIIDAGRSPTEISKAVVAYLVTLPFFR